MDTLPLELIRELCVILKYDREALHALTLVNSRLYKAAAPLFYDCVLVKFSGFSDLESITAEYAENGLGKQFLESATRLEIIAYPERTRSVGYNARHERGSRDMTATLQDFLPVTVGSFMKDYMSYVHLPAYGRHLDQYPGYYTEKQWQPLVSLIGRLKHLKSMHYAVANSFPRALLDAIHGNHRDCEINIWSPQSLSLQFPGADKLRTRTRSPIPDCIEDDPFDMEIFRSSSLHAICIDYPFLMSECYTDNFHLHEIIPYISQAPKLKHVHLQLHRPWGSDVQPTRPEVSRDILDRQPLANISSFSVQSLLYEDRIFWKWYQTMGFSSLRSLYLPTIECPSLLKNAATGLLSLERLSICVENPRRSWEGMCQEVLHTFERLRPLKYLSILGLEDILFLHTILRRHGPSLKGLMLEPYESRSTFIYTEQRPRYNGWLYPLLDHTHLQRIAAQCPNVTDLRVPIRRSKGDRLEVLTYRALRGFSNLENLILDLYGNPRPLLCTEDGLFSAEGVGASLPPIHINLVDALMNFATDSALAQSIWKEISSSQPSYKLKQLRISPLGYNAFSSGMIHAILTLAPSLLVSHGGTKVIEIGKAEKQAEQEFLAYEDEFTIDDTDIDHCVVPHDLLNSIWPPKSSDTDWTTSWKSLPLQTDV